MEKIIEFAKQYERFVKDMKEQNIDIIRISMFGNSPIVQLDTKNSIAGLESMITMSEEEAKKQTCFVGIKKLDGVYFSQVVGNDDPRFAELMESAIDKTIQKNNGGNYGI